MSKLPILKRRVRRFFPGTGTHGAVLGMLIQRPVLWSGLHRAGEEHGLRASAQSR